MKIFNYGVQGVNPYAAAKRKEPVKEAGQSFADKLEISSTAKELTMTNEYVDQRAEKVKKLKAEIQSGTYKVDANKVAEDMLKYYKF